MSTDTFNPLRLVIRTLIYFDFILHTTMNSLLILFLQHARAHKHAWDLVSLIEAKRGVDKLLIPPRMSITSYSTALVAPSGRCIVAKISFTAFFLEPNKED